MHDTDFISDLDTGNSSQVAESRILDVGIEDGVQTFPSPATSETANRLMIFTGTAICEIPADGDGELSRGVVRVRLRFPVSRTLQFVGSATVAALASVHGSDDADAVFAVDAADTIVGPTDGGSLPDNGLPADDLYVIMDAATQGPDTLLSRIAYQANVLVKDLEPDLDSLLLKPDGFGVFAPEITIASRDKWDFQVTLTGPVIDRTFLIPLQSSDPNAVPVPAATELGTGQTSGSFLGGTATNPERGVKTVTITASGKRVTKTAILHVLPTPA
jgi:hypothetical protein